jgi:hypothetical protein
VPLVSPKDSHCDSEEVTAVEDAGLMGFYGEPREIEEVSENPRRFRWRVPYPTASVDGIWMELVESDESLSPLSGGSRNPIHEESSKIQIATNPLRENVKDQ